MGSEHCQSPFLLHLKPKKWAAIGAKEATQFSRYERKKNIKKMEGRKETSQIPNSYFLAVVVF